MGCGKHFRCYPLDNILFAVVLEGLIQFTRCFSAEIAFLCSLSEFSAEVYKPVLQLLQIPVGVTLQVLRDLLEIKKTRTAVASNPVWFSWSLPIQYINNKVHGIKHYMNVWLKCDL